MAEDFRNAHDREILRVDDGIAACSTHALPTHAKKFNHSWGTLARGGRHAVPSSVLFALLRPAQCFN